jgi:hypothetical protein
VTGYSPGASPPSGSAPSIGSSFTRSMLQLPCRPGQSFAHRHSFVIGEQTSELFGILLLIVSPVRALNYDAPTLPEYTQSTTCNGNLGASCAGTWARWLLQRFGGNFHLIVWKAFSPLARWSNRYKHSPTRWANLLIPHTKPFPILTSAAPARALLIGTDGDVVEGTAVCNRSTAEQSSLLSRSSSRCRWAVVWRWRRRP